MASFWKRLGRTTHVRRREHPNLTLDCEIILFFQHLKIDKVENGLSCCLKKSNSELNGILSREFIQRTYDSFLTLMLVLMSRTLLHWKRAKEMLMWFVVVNDVSSSGHMHSFHCMHCPQPLNWAILSMAPIATTRSILGSKISDCWAKWQPKQDLRGLNSNNHFSTSFEVKRRMVREVWVCGRWRTSESNA